MALRNDPSPARSWFARRGSAEFTEVVEPATQIGWRPVAVAASPEPRSRQIFISSPIDCLTSAETIAAIEAAIRGRVLLRHSCLNVAKLVAARHSPDLDFDLRSSDIVSVDGMGIVWGARLLGIHVPERVTGIDLMDKVLQLCARNGYRPYFLGARPEVVERAVANMTARHPGLHFAGWRNGYFDAGEEENVVAGIRASGADCLFIGMPTPYKERFLCRHAEALGVPFVMGVGGSFDVLAGEVRRAPPLLQRIGLEWLFRTIQEPLRLGPRYITTNCAFAVIMLKALLTRRLAP